MTSDSARRSTQFNNRSGHADRARSLPRHRHQPAAIGDLVDDYIAEDDTRDVSGRPGKAVPSVTPVVGAVGGLGPVSPASTGTPTGQPPLAIPSTSGHVGGGVLVAAILLVLGGVAGAVVSLKAVRDTHTHNYVDDNSATDDDDNSATDDDDDNSATDDDDNDGSAHDDNDRSTDNNDNDGSVNYNDNECVPGFGACP